MHRIDRANRDGFARGLSDNGKCDRGVVESIPPGDVANSTGMGALADIETRK